MAVKTKANPKKGKASAEDQYRETFGDYDEAQPEQPMFFSQPSPYKQIRTVTTYGAYEDPV
jgi:hypothetical protein